MRSNETQIHYEAKLFIAILVDYSPPDSPTSAMSNAAGTAAARKCCLVMGVVNQRSIAWQCVQSFTQRGYDCVFTFQDPKHQSKMEKLCVNETGILGCLPCDVTTQLPAFFDRNNGPLVNVLQDRKLDAVVHSIAHATTMGKPLVETTLQEYIHAHHVSAYSFLETVCCSRYLMQKTESGPTPAYTALAYLGSTRAVAGYGIMGSAKASLESLVRGLSLEQMNSDDGIRFRCNAVSTGPLRTAASRAIPHFASLQQLATEHSPCPFTAQDVADTIVWLSTTGGITGQVIYVDGGFSSIVPIPKLSKDL
jgi:enoyl-[acyl-carrier protein] reductase I